MFAIIFSLAVAGMTCPPIKINIITPLNPEDKRALQEHKDRCLATKSWPCLIKFAKVSPGNYTGTCSNMVEDN